MQKLTLTHSRITRSEKRTRLSSFSDQYRLLGLLYVIEGSTLGDIPFVFITGYDEINGIKENGFENIKLMLKPFKQDELEEALSNILPQQSEI